MVEILQALAVGALAALTGLGGSVGLYELGRWIAGLPDLEGHNDTQERK